MGEIPSCRRGRMTRQAITPRFAIRTFWNISICRVPNQYSDWRRVVSVAGIVQLRTITDYGEHIHVGAHLDVLARSRYSILKCKFAFRCDGNVHEKIDVVSDIALFETAAPCQRGLYE